MTEAFAVAPDGVRLWTQAQGSGPAVVLTHGGPGLWDYFDDLAALLAPSATVIRWEQRGCGRSDLAGPYRVETFVEDLDAVRRHWGLGPCIVAGHSFGATLALQYALAHPEAASALLYISGTGIGTAWRTAARAEADRRLSAEQREEREWLSRLEHRDRDQEVRHRVLAWLPDYADPQRAEEFAYRMASAPFEVNYTCNAELGAEDRAWPEEELAKRCARLERPALLIHGALDPRPASALGSLVEALPAAELHVLAGAGHLPWVEAPLEVASLVAGFVAR